MSHYTRLISGEEISLCADPHFKSRKRICNMPECDKVFMTTPLRRMFCAICFSRAKRNKLTQTYATRGWKRPLREAE